MTDEQIEKAIECCIKGDCLHCPNMQHNSIGATVCKQRLITVVPDYINRLKAENERLKQSDMSKENCTIEQHAEIHKLRDELEQVRKNTAKEIIEELKGDMAIATFTFNPTLASELKTIYLRLEKEYGVEE